MLDPRLTRIFLLPVLAVLVLAAFSVQERPKPLRTFQAQDAIRGETALADVNVIAARYPSRPVGSTADRDAAVEVARRFRDAGLEVRTTEADVQTADGEGVQATQVLGRRDGPASGVIVVAASRDTIRPGSRAEATGTAMLLQLADVLGRRRVEHPVVLASVSGTPGQAGYRALADELQSLDEPIRAVIVLGTLGTRDVAPPVVASSNGPEIASHRLRRTLEDALAAERSVGDARAGALAQLVRIAAPVTTGGQGPLLRAGLPAVLLSTTGDRIAPEGLEPQADRLAADGRAVLRAVTAIDNAPGGLDLEPEQRILAADGAIPGWAIRAIVLALLVPTTLLVVDGIARASREKQKVGRWVLWTLLLAVPQLLGIVAVAVAAGAGWLALPGGPVDPALWGQSLAPLLLFVGATAVGHLLVRPLALFGLGLWGKRSSVPGAPIGLAVVLVLTALATWVVNPVAAALMVPAVLIWPVVLDTGMRPSRPAAVLSVLAGLVPLVVLTENVLARYPIGGPLPSLSWFAALLGDGGIGLFPQLWFALLSGCAIGALLLALHGRSVDPGDTATTTRGPATYAGPGSLGGTDSALRSGPTR